MSERTVEFTCYIDESNQWRNVQTKTGKFHTWGEFAIPYEESGTARWTVAIVEDADGRVYRIPPEALKFTS
jgi:hypothetical protein